MGDDPLALGRPVLHCVRDLHWRGDDADFLRGVSMSGSTAQFLHSIDLEIATIRRRNLLTALSSMSLASCSLKDPEAAIAEFSGLVADCDKEIEQLNRAMQAQEDV